MAQDCLLEKFVSHFLLQENPFPADPLFKDFAAKTIEARVLHAHVKYFYFSEVLLVA